MGTITEAKTETAEEYEYIFERYLAICGLAIEKNKDKFPYMEIWKAYWEKQGSKNILECAVYDDRPKVIYKFQLVQNMKIKIIGKTRHMSNDAWPFKFSYMKHVVDHPQDYIDHPAKLDWDWLTGSFG